MQNKDEVRKIVREAVIETFDLKEEINNDDLAFREDLKADSIDMVSLSLVLEEEFGAEIEDDQLANLVTIKDVIDYVVDRQEQDAA